MHKPKRIYYHNGERLDPSDFYSSSQVNIDYIDAMDDEETRCEGCYGYGGDPTHNLVACDECKGSGYKPVAHLITELRNSRDLAFARLWHLQHGDHVYAKQVPNRQASPERSEGDA